MTRRQPPQGKGRRTKKTATTVPGPSAPSSSSTESSPPGTASSSHDESSSSSSSSSFDALLKTHVNRFQTDLLAVDENAKDETTNHNNCKEDAWTKRVRKSVQQLVREMANLNKQKKKSQLKLQQQKDDEVDGEEEVSSPSPNNNNNNNDVALALMHMMDCALASTDSNNSISKTSSAASAAASTSWNVLEFVAAFIVTASGHQDQATTDVALLVLQHAVDYTVVLLERIRGAACYFLGQYLKHYYINIHNSRSASTGGGNNNNDNNNVLLDLVSQALVARATDKSAAVRRAFCQAVGAASAPSGTCFALQEPDVLTALLYLCQHDPVATNRVAALRALPCASSTNNNHGCLQTLEALVVRLADVSALVRVAAANQLETMSSNNNSNIASNSSVRQEEKDTDNNQDLWDAELRAAVVQAGWTERCAATKQATLGVVLAWIRATDYNPLTLLKQMNVSQYQTQCQTVAAILLQQGYSCSTTNQLSILTAMEDEDDDSKKKKQLLLLQRGLQRATRQVSIVRVNQEFSVEELLWANAVCAYATTTTTNSSSLQDTVVPDVPLLCQVLEAHLDKLAAVVVAKNDHGQDDDDEEEEEHGSSSNNDVVEDEDLLIFKCLQLLQLVPVHDSLEEGSRRHLSAFLQNVLVSLTAPEDLVEPCLELYAKIQTGTGGETAAKNGIVEMIQALRQQLQQLQQNDDDGALEEHVWARMLSILSVVGENPVLAPRVLNSDDLHSDELILEALHHNNNNDGGGGGHSDMVRQLAVTCLGQLGLWSMNTSAEKKRQVVHEWQPILLGLAASSSSSSSNSEPTEIRSQALLALSDWAMVDPNAFLSSSTTREDDDDENESSSGGLVQLVTQQFETEESNNDILGLCIAAEIAAKLLLRVLRSPSHNHDALWKAWLPHLVVLFFDAQLQQDNDGDDDDDDLEQQQAASAAAITDVGSPARLQQLLSVFFPALVAVGKGEALLESLSSVLEIILLKSSAQQKKKGGRKNKAGPFAKTIAYLCDTVRQGQQEQLKQQQPVDQEDSNNKDEVKIIPVDLMAALEVATLLSKTTQPLNRTVLRALHKVLASFDLEINDNKNNHKANTLASKLVRIVQELEMETDDAACLDCLAQVLAVLPKHNGNVDDEEEENDDDEETETEEEEEEEQVDDEESLDNENSWHPRESTASNASTLTEGTTTARSSTGSLRTSTTPRPRRAAPDKENNSSTGGTAVPSKGRTEEQRVSIGSSVHSTTTF